MNYDKTLKDLILVFLNFFKSGKDETIMDVMRFYSHFASFDELSNYILYKLEENLSLDKKTKDILRKKMQSFYEAEKKNTSKYLGIKYTFTKPDKQAIDFVDSMNDFYLGKFFQGDKEVRREVLKWMDNYYLTSGNPIGKGQKGISVFLENFGDKLSDISERKSRQIIDTTMNTIRNFAKVRSYAEANIESFVWDATNDRLTCAACRSLDGRIFKTKYAAAQIDEIITSAPENLPDKRPIITQPFKGKTDDFSLNSPPMHPLCRCTTAAFFDSAPVEYNISRPENVLVTSDQLELEKTFQNLTNDEIHNRVTAHLGSVWARPPKNPQKKHIDQFLGSHIEKKFNKHVLTQNEFPSISSVEKYKQKAYDIIKKPDKVYVEIGTDKKPYYAFFESDIMVIISDDNMSISSMYRIGEEKWLEKQRKAVIRIY